MSTKRLSVNKPFAPFVNMNFPAYVRQASKACIARVLKLLPLRCEAWLSSKGDLRLLCFSKEISTISWKHFSLDLVLNFDTFSSCFCFLSAERFTGKRLSVLTISGAEARRTQRWTESQGFDEDCEALDRFPFQIDSEKIIFVLDITEFLNPWTGFNSSFINTPKVLTITLKSEVSSLLSPHMGECQLKLRRKLRSENSKYFWRLKSAYLSSILTTAAKNKASC